MKNYILGAETTAQVRKVLTTQAEGPGLGSLGPTKKKKKRLSVDVCVPRILVLGKER